MTWIERIFRKPVRTIVRRKSTAHLCVQSLEERTVPAVVTGTVFNDFNYNGAQDVNPTVPNQGNASTIRLANEVGLAGISVSITDSLGATQTTSTLANGSYSLTLTGTGPYRVMVTTPSGFTPGPTAGNNQGNVRFVAEGNSTVDFGLVRPEQYVQPNPKLVVNRYAFGSSVGNTAPAIQTFDYSAGSNSTTSAAGYPNTVPATLVETSQIGSTWGLAYNKTTQTLFASSFYRRHADFGPASAGPNAIYAINATTGAVTVLNNSVNTGGNPHTADFLTDNASRTVVNGVTIDSGWDSAGKIGWGGMAISDDGNTLYAMNLFDRRLYAFNSATGAVITSVAVPLETNGRPDTDSRPFAVQFFQGRVYVGVTDTAESTVTDANPLGNASQLRAYVYSYDAALAAAPQTVLNFGLNYPRGDADATATLAGSATKVPAAFLPWSRGYSQLNTAGTSGFEVAFRPMPWLTGLSFDATGNLTLGIRDRIGDTIGNETSSDPGRPGTLIRAIAVGDILRAFGSPASGYTLENNGTGPGGTPAGQSNQAIPKGPGGGEFYSGDKIPAGGGTSTPSGNNHDQLAMGAVLQLPGHPDVVSTFVDPVPIFGEFYQGGVRWLSNENGTFTKGYRVYLNQTNAGVINPSSFGKANGLGDLEVLSANPPTTVIGDRIFDDVNNNGRQDAGEAGLGNITVNLVRGGVVVNTATTSTAGLNAGLYQFTQEADGSALRPNTAYQIRIPLNQAGLANRFITRDNVVGVPADINSKIVADGNGNAVINFTTGAVGQNNFDLDGGFSTLASVGNFVFGDTNGNGIQDAGEVGVAGVQVQLFDSNNQQVGATQTTAADGLYSFTGLLPGTYRVRFVPSSLPQGTAFSPQQQGNNPALDSNPDPATGFTPTFTLAAGQNDLTIDAGVQTLASLGDTVFRDLNGNGIQDAGDPGVAGVQVQLFNAQGVQVGTTQTTNANGRYSFNGLQPGQYRVRFVPGSLPADTAFTAPRQGNNPALDSDADPVTGDTPLVTLVNGQNDTTIDAGIVNLTASVGDTVFRDLDGNGLQDPGEPGVAGVRVQLLDSQGNPVGSPAVTDAQGNYLFTAVTPGTYSVRFDPTTLPAGTAFTRPLQGGNTAIDSDANPLTGQTATFTLAGRQNLRTIDAGIVSLASLGGSVYVDLNNDGLRQTSEDGIPNTPIRLSGTDDLGNPVSLTTTTDGLGNYRFPTLRPGTYIVTEPVQPANFANGKTTAGTTGGVAGNDIITNVVLAPGANSLRNNFGELPISVTQGVTDVQVVQTVSNPRPNVGETVFLTVVVTNNGPNTAFNTTVGLPLPPGLQPLGVTSITQGTFDLNTLSWSIGTLPVGQQVTLVIPVRVLQGGTFDNTAVVSVSNQETTLANNRSPVEIRTPDAGGVSKQNFLTLPPAPPIRQTLPLQAPPQAASTTSDGLIALGTQAGAPPLVQVFDRRSGAERFAFYAYDPSFTGGVNVAMGDLNGDGVADVVTAAASSGAPHVKAFDGVTGQEIRSFFAYDPNFRGGINVAVGDINGDGTADIITATGLGNAPHVKVFDGRTGSELQSFFAYDTTYTGGVSLAVGDLDGDGRREIITGSQRGFSHVKAFDAAGGEVRSFFAYSPVFLGGVNVAAGDIDGDGRDDIITGAGPGGGPHIKAFAGGNGSDEVRSFFADASSFSGGVRVATADVTADGLADILVTPASGAPTMVRTFSSRTGELIDSFLGNDPAYTGGASVAASRTTVL